jgi:hypothetical protein
MGVGRIIKIIIIIIIIIIMDDTWIRKNKD